MEDEKEFITFEEAVKMLPDGDAVHTFRSPAPGLMIGADWSREDLLEKMKKAGLELSGTAATAMKHGIALIDDQGPLFIATKGE